MEDQGRSKPAQRPRQDQFSVLPHSYSRNVRIVMRWSCSINRGTTFLQNCQPTVFSKRKQMGYILSAQGPF